MDLTQKEIEVLTHTLGYNYTPRHPRNHYAVNPGSEPPEVSSLVAKGLMYKGWGTSKLHPHGIVHYHATTQGEEIAKSFEQKPPRTTVGALKELLAQYPDELEVVLAKDAEGNGFSPLSNNNYSPSVEFFERSSTYSYELLCVEDALKDDTTDEQAALVLWPKN